MNHTPLTKDDVRTVFKELLDKNLSTTTLDVKNELRNKGFYATQGYVSYCMDEIATEDNIDFEIDNGHRMYLSPNLSTAVAAVQIANDAASKCGPTMGPGYSQNMKKKRVPADPSLRIEIADIKDVQPNDWQCGHVTMYGSLQVGHYDSRLTRNQARYAYSKNHNVPYKDVSAMRAAY